MNGLYIVLIIMAIGVALFITLLAMAAHDNNIDRKNWNNKIKIDYIDLITTCTEFNNRSLGSNGFWVQDLYFNDKNKFMKDNQEMYDYIENKGKVLGCLND